MASLRAVKLTVITDFVCICCCIGQHELLDAIAYCKDTLALPLQFEFEYVPFRLVSTNILPEDQPCRDRVEFLTKYLGKERYDALESNINRWAEEKNRPITLNGTINQTTKAHRLVLKAGKMGGQAVQMPLMTALFAASMEEHRDISDVEVLADVAEKCGVMSKEQAIEFLNSDELKKEVEEMSNAARAKGITGVPITIIDGKWAVNGGQSSDVYIQIFKKLASCGVHCAPSPMPSSFGVDPCE